MRNVTSLLEHVFMYCMAVLEHASTVVVVSQRGRHDDAVRHANLATKVDTFYIF